MSVDFESYQPSDPPDDGTNGRRILEHLAQHPELGFTPSELADDREIPRRSVGTTLDRLEERGLVRHNGEYWASIPRRTTRTLPVSSASGPLLTSSRAITTVRTPTGTRHSQMSTPRRAASAARPWKHRRRLQSTATLLDDPPSF